MDGDDLFIAGGGEGEGTVSESTTSGVLVNSNLISAPLDQPVAIAVAGSDLFIVNVSNGTVGEYTTSGATVNASLISGLVAPSHIAVDGSDLFITSNDGVSEYTTSGTLVNPSLIFGGGAIAVDGSDLFVVNPGIGTVSGGTVGLYTTSGAVVNSSLITGLDEPTAIAVDGSDLFIANQGCDGSDCNGTVSEYTTSGTLVNASLISLSGTTFADIAVVPSQDVFNGGTVSAASFTAGGAVAPGSIAAVFGAQLASAVTSASAVPLPTSLGGTSVTMNEFPAPLFLVTPGQINLQVPWELAGQTQASLVATVNGTQLAPVTVALAPAAPGIFTLNQQGTGQGAIVDQGPVSPVGAFAAPAGSVPGAMAYPAASGDTVTIYCTGLGSVNNPPATGAVGSGQSTTATPVVTIGGIPATVSFSGLVPTLVGEYQINAQVPADAPSGNAVPVTVTIDGVTSNVATMAIP